MMFIDNKFCITGAFSTFSVCLRKDVSDVELMAGDHLDAPSAMPAGATNRFYSEGLSMAFAMPIMALRAQEIEMNELELYEVIECEVIEIELLEIVWELLLK